MNFVRLLTVVAAIIFAWVVFVFVTPFLVAELPNNNLVGIWLVLRIYIAFASLLLCVLGQGIFRAIYDWVKAE